jgi:hypothetical protein
MALCDDGLPLHIKQVKRLSWAKADELIEQQFSATPLSDIWRQLTAPFRCTQTVAQMMSNINDAVFEDVILDIADIEQLVAAGFLLEIEESEARGFCRSFTVVEKAKGRRRWILHPFWFNSISDVQDLEVPFPRPEDLAAKVTQWKYAVCMDFAWFFGSFPTNTGEWFTLKKGNKYYKPTTVATGARQPPLFAQLLTLAIIASVRRECETNTAGDAFIDNVRLLANEKSVLEKMVHDFYAIVDDLGITVNESKAEVINIITSDDSKLTKYTFLGLEFDHIKKTVALAEKTKNKIKVQLENFKQQQEWKAWLSLFGLCIFGASTLGIDKSKYYWVYKFIRKKTSTVATTEAQVTIWPSITQLWKEWLDEILTSPPRCLEKKSSLVYTLVTDASLKGWGAILFGPSGEHIVAGPWTGRYKGLHINLLELTAVRFAVELLIENFIGSGLHVLIDNTTALAHITRGRSNRFRYNHQIHGINKCLARGRAWIQSVNYIKSAHNPADQWSRLLWRPHALYPVRLFRRGNLVSTPGQWQRGHGEAVQEETDQMIRDQNFPCVSTVD